MDAPPVIQKKVGAKLWDFLFGCLVIGAAPWAAMEMLELLLGWICRSVFHHYGEAAAFRLQTIGAGFAILAAIVAFAVAISWRARHRVLPIGLLAVEIIIAVFWALLLMAFLAVLVGPNDNWNK